MTQPTFNSLMKHNIHKFHDIKPKLEWDNWISWKHELLATFRDRGLYVNIIRSDKLPIVASITMTFDQLLTEWEDWNNSAYNQILLCISSELQLAIDNTDKVHQA